VALSDRADNHRAGLAALTLGALGVVYGDIGTSPLYAFRETFHNDRLAVDDANVIGALSLVFWALIIIVSVKYLLYVLRADNKGEGGILALTSLVAPRHGAVVIGRLKWLVLLGLFGTALLYGDGVITPAISVLSAVEGLKVVEPSLESYVIPIAVGILVALFAVQKRGTGAVGKVFGPIMLVWFSVLGVLGVTNLIDDLSVLAAINPLRGLDYLFSNGWAGFLSLGSIFLVVTGGEALYADMGHFGRSPIRAGWFTVALPCLLLNYFGQSALLINNPEAIENPFFLMGPEWARPFLVALATCATIIASQALISGAFSMTVQAVQLDYLPRLAISHTSASHMGQVYVPIVNWLLMLGSISLVLGFQTSSNLAAAYGIAVTGTMGVTTVLMASFAHDTWKWSLPKVMAVTVPLLVIDLAFFGANVAKIPNGGWFPIVVAMVIIVAMTTWRTGRRILAERIRRGETPIERFLEDVATSGMSRVPGTAVFLFKGSGAAPPALITNTRHNHVLHERVILLSILTDDVPTVDELRRSEIQEYGNGVFQVTLHYGFMEEPDVEVALLKLSDDRLPLTAESLTFFLGRETVIASTIPGMANWRERLFAFQLRSAASAARFFRLPADRVVEVGSQVEI
jgi:KUP system potassium uptake protein